MQTSQWLKQAEQELAKVDVPTARLDALVLLEDVTGLDRAKLLAEPERELTASQVKELKKLLSRRAQHEPLAYVRGKTEFYGREFNITAAVLEPRPESETMIDELKQLKNLPKEVRIADVGAGSGALGITCQLELSEAQIDLLELDPKALKIAKINVDKFTLATSTILSDLLAGSDRNYDVLLCNLPYVPDSHTINQAALHEPHMAIFGGPDGLDLYRRLFKQAQKRDFQPLFILTESLPPQHPALVIIAEEYGFKLLRSNDFIQVFEKN